MEVLNLATKSTTLFSNLTVFCHVGLSGVMKSNIGNVLNADDFLKQDIKYVFSGHFHNHVAFDARVYSVGSLTHQTWSDLGSIAGYLLVTEEKVTQHETAAPKFVLLPEDCFGIGKFHPPSYVRITGEETEESITELREICLKNGAIAVQDLSTRPTMIEKKAVRAVDIDLGLDSAIEAYCKNTFGERWSEILKEAQEVKNAL
jgi:DNA repair exonuclease SbcCD nuclease subunit